MTTLDHRGAAAKLRHAAWLCSRVGMAIELWAWPWMLGLSSRIDRYEINDLAIHFGPLTLRLRYCFRPDDDGRA
jgi:hypothetical protein